MKLRAVLVVPVALLACIYVLRVAFVGAFATSAPERAATIWPGHPAVILESGLADVGRSAAKGADPDPALVDRLLGIYRKAPLAPEPLLVRGVQAQLAGDNALAGRAFLAARNHDPRNVAARYFLADHYQRTAQMADGLEEVSALARLVPQSLPGLAPYLAAFARTPGAAPQVKAMIRRQPQLEAELLNALAADAANRDLVLQLWSGRGGDAARIWQARLLNSLVAAQQYDQAHAVWSRFTGADADGDELLGPGIGARSLPPFGWSFASGSAGLAEAEPGGGLHILYYGRDRLLLASRLMTLAPGSYRMSLRVSGGAGGADTLSWSVVCLPASNQLASIELSGAAKGGTISASFTVPPACPAQRIGLTGLPSELPQQADLSISNLHLEREVGRR